MWMCALVTLVTLTIPFSASADSMRDVKPNPISCTGQLKDNPSKKIDLTVQYTAAGGTRIEIKGALERTLENPAPLTVGSEGTVYIQQVSNDRGYNLFLAGEGLEDLLNGNDDKSYVLSGNIDFFNDHQVYELSCKSAFAK